MFRLLVDGEWPKHGVDQFFNSQGIWITVHGDIDEPFKEGDPPIRRKIPDDIVEKLNSTPSAEQQLKDKIAALEKELSCYRERDRFGQETKNYECY